MPLWSSPNANHHCRQKHDRDNIVMNGGRVVSPGRRRVARDKFYITIKLNESTNAGGNEPDTKVP